MFRNDSYLYQRYSIRFALFQMTLDSRVRAQHYENMLMQYTETFSGVKYENIIEKKKINIFLIFAQNIDCWYTLDPWLGGSNEYPQSVF